MKAVRCAAGVDEARGVTALRVAGAGPGTESFVLA